MQFFMRMSKLSNIVGRADYISNPARQEHIVLARSYADWKPYQEFERTHRKSSKANNEGRELIIALPNEWGQLGEIELASRMNELAQKILPGKTEYQWAIHWNKAHTNLHIHLIFSERDRQYTSSGVWDRDIYLTKDGKVARRKADRAVDRNGKVKPPVHRKGEPKDAGKPGFTPKDTKFKSRKWLDQAKVEAFAFLIRHGVVPEQYGVLHQHHEGKGSGAVRIQKINADIRILNRAFQQFQEFGFVLPEYHSDLRGKMISALLDPKRETGFFDTVYPFVSHSFEFAKLPYKPEIRRSLIVNTKNAGIKTLLRRDDIIVKKQDADQVQRTIDDLTRKLSVAGVPSELKKQENTPKVMIKDMQAPLKAYQEEKRSQERAAKRLTEQQASRSPRQDLPPSPPLPDPDLSKPPQSKQATPTVASPNPSNPVDPKKIIALRDDYFRKSCVHAYLEFVRPSTKEQKAHDAASKVFCDFDEACKQYNGICRQFYGTMNPIKKIKLRPELEKATVKLNAAVNQLHSALGISLYIGDHRFDSADTTDEDVTEIWKRAKKAVEEQYDRAKAEKEKNASIQKLADEKITTEKIQAARIAFENACKTVPKEQQQAVYIALCKAPVPSHYEFEQDGYISKGRRTANETISRVVSAMKPAAPVQKHEIQPPRHQELEQDSYQNRGFHR